MDIPANETCGPASHKPLMVRTRDLPGPTNDYPDQSPLSRKRKLNIIDRTTDNSAPRRLSLILIPASPSKRSRSSRSSSSDASYTSAQTSTRRPSPHFLTTSITNSNGQGEFRSRLDVTKAKRVTHVISGLRNHAKAQLPPTPEEEQKRRHFLRNLSVLNDVILRNDIDNDSPPTEFEFVRENILSEGVFRATEEIMLGCGCQKKYSQQNGCVYLDYCTCIEDSAEDDHGRKYFAYGASERNYRLLRGKVLNTRNHIYECNSKCDCTQNCKNRVVQHGRQIRVEIFKTPDRGWALRSLEDLRRGQFIDTYRGEIITSEEADRRAQSLTEEENNNFFFDFDKFKTERPEAYDPERAYVCDGRYYGSPARFFNHSCDPNCAIYTVSYNHNDRNIYELAYFATEDVPRGTELTFDYYDNDEATIISDEMAQEFEEEKGYAATKCLCGSKECRGYFLH